MDINSKRLKEPSYAKEVCLYLLQEHNLKAVIPCVNHFISVSLDSEICYVSMIQAWKECNSLANGLGGDAAKAFKLSQDVDLLLKIIDCSNGLNDLPKLLFCSSEIIEKLKSSNNRLCT